MSPPPPRALRRAMAALALASLASCGWLESALQVHVTLDSRVQATCVKVSVFTSSDTSGAPADARMLARDPGKDDFTVGIYRGKLPSTVFVTAQPLYGVECNDPLLPNGDLVVKSGTFPPSGFTPVDLAVNAPPVAEDADGDGFVAGPAGPDCNDNNAQIHPGATEHCQEAADYNCDNRIGCADPTCASVSCLPSPTQLTFANAPVAFAAGACSAAIPVDTTSATGAVVPVVASTAVTFSAPDGNLSVFADPACATPLTSFTLLTGRSRATVYVTGTAAGTARLSASAPGLGTVEQAETIQPGPVAQLAFTTAAQTVPLYGCSGQVTVQLRDAQGNPTSAGTPLSVALTSNAGSSFRFYPDAACANAAITQTPVASGANSSTFYFKSTATSAGTVTITATSGTHSQSQTETLVVRIPTTLVFPNAPVTVAANVCSPAVTLQTQDGSGQAAPVVSPLTISLSSNPSGLTFFSNSGCTTSATSTTILSGLSSTTFWFKGPQGTPTITANGGAFGSPQQTETITAPVPTTLAFATAAQANVTANVCSGSVTIEARDGTGTATAVQADTQINLATNPTGQLALYSGPGCAGTPISSALMTAGTSSVTVSFKGTLAASTDIIASTAGNVLASATQTEGVVAAAGTKVLIVTGKNQTLAAGACGSLTLERQDPYGNATTGNNETMDLASSPSSGMAFYGNNTCTGTPVTTVALPSTSTRVFTYFKATASGAYTLTETPRSTLTGDTAGETITGGTPTQLMFISAAQSGVVAGQCSAPVTVGTFDSAGNPANVGANTTVTVGSTGLTGVSFYGNGTCNGSAVTSVTIAAGTGSATYSFQTNAAGTGTLTATASGLTAATPQSVTVVAAAATKVLIVAGKNQSIATGVCGALTLERDDQYGNATTGSLETMNLSSSPTTGMAFYSGSNCNGGSISTVQLAAASTQVLVYFKSSTAGSYTLTEAPQSTLTGDSASETITSGTAIALTFTSTAQNSVTAGNCSAAVTVTAVDAGNNPANVTSSTAVTVGTTGATNTTLYSSSSCSTAVTSVTIPSGSSSATYYFKGTTAGSGTLTATATGLTSATPQGYTIVAGAPAKLAILQGPFTVAAGSCTGAAAPISVQVQDSFGNPSAVASSITVNISASSTDTPAPYQLSFNQNCNGGGPLTSFVIGTGGTTSSNIYFQSDGAGTWTITVTSSPLTQASQNETVTPLAPSQLAWVTTAQTVARNGCSGVVTVQIQDSLGNPSPVASATDVTLAPGNFFRTAGCSNSITNNIVTVSAGQTNASFYFRAPGTAGSYTISATATGVGSQISQIETIN